MSDPAVAREWNDGGTSHIDVRGLPPPQPLVAVLRRVHAMSRDQHLVVHHDRDPLLLYPELEEIGWYAQRVPAPVGEVRLVVRALP